MQLSLTNVFTAGLVLGAVFGSISGNINGRSDGLKIGIAHVNLCQMRWLSSRAVAYDLDTGCYLYFDGDMHKEIDAVKLGAKINMEYLSTAPIEVIEFVTR
jgi:hypothetical protein